MTQSIKLNIPLQVAVAAGKAAYETWTKQIREHEKNTLDPELLDELCPAWEDLSDNNQQDWISQGADAVRAGIAAWPGININKN